MREWFARVMLCLPMLTPRARSNCADFIASRGGYRNIWSLFKAYRANPAGWDANNSLEAIFQRHANNITTVIIHSISLPESFWISEFAEYRAWEFLGRNTLHHLLYLLAKRDGIPPRVAEMVTALKENQQEHLAIEVLSRLLIRESPGTSVDWIATELIQLRWYPNDPTLLPVSVRRIFFDNWNDAVSKSEKGSIQLPPHIYRKPDTPYELGALLALSPHGTAGREPQRARFLIERCKDHVSQNLEAFLFLANNSLPAIRAAAVDCVTNAANISSGLTKALTQPQLRPAVVRVLAARLNDEDLPALQSLLLDSDPETRLLALRSVSRRNAGKYEAAILLRIEKTDPEPNIRLAAGEILCSIGRKLDRSLLFALLRSDLTENRVRAIRTLREIGLDATDTPSLLPVIMKDPEPNVARSAASLLLDANEPVFVPAMRELLQHKFEDIQMKAATRILAILPGDQQTQQIMRTLGNTNPANRQFLIKNGLLKSAEGVKDFLQMLVDSTSVAEQNSILRKVVESGVSCSWGSLPAAIQDRLCELRFRLNPDQLAIQLMDRFGWKPQGRTEIFWTLIEKQSYEAAIRANLMNISPLLPLIETGKHRNGLATAAVAINEPATLHLLLRFMETVSQNLRHLPEIEIQTRFPAFAIAARNTLTGRNDLGGYWSDSIEIPDDVNLCITVAQQIIRLIENDRRQKTNMIHISRTGVWKPPHGNVVLATGNRHNQENNDRFDGTFVPSYKHIPFTLPGFERLSAIMNGRQ